MQQNGFRVLGSAPRQAVACRNGTCGCAYWADARVGGTDWALSNASPDIRHNFRRRQRCIRALRHCPSSFRKTCLCIVGARLPNHPRLLQLYVWQEYNLAPHFPEPKGFLGYWERELEGALHSVRVAYHRLIEPSEWHAVDGVIAVH